MDSRCKHTVHNISTSMDSNINASMFFGYQSVKQIWHRIVPCAMNHSNGRYIWCCTWHIEISPHYLLNWKQLDATVYHHWLLLPLGSSRGLEEYLLHSKRLCPLFIIFDNKSCFIWSLTIFVMIKHSCLYIWIFCRSGIPWSQTIHQCRQTTYHLYNQVKTASSYCCYQRQPLSYFVENRLQPKLWLLLCFVALYSISFSL